MDTYDRVMIALMLGFIIIINYINCIALVHIEENVEVLVNALVK